MRLVEENLALVGSVISKYYPYLTNHHEYDDLFQTGCLGLIKAAKLYKGKLLKYEFSTVAFFHIRAQLNYIARRFHSKKYGPSFHERSLDELINENQSLGDVIGCDDYDSIDNVIVLQRLFNVLNERERKVMHMHLEGYTAREIGDVVGVTGSYIGKIERGAIEKMKTAL